MKIILNQDIKDLGKKGQLVNVSDGYAKNYLIPRKLAVIADAGAMNQLKNREASAAHKLAVEKATAEENAAKLEGKTVKVSANAGANGRLFGSVTSKEIAEKVKEQFGVELEKKKYIVDDIRAYGVYPVTVKVYSGIQVQMFVLVGD
ncbi:MAG: 50S ribosomal protein L9 [Clostridia bacterium]|nr:50S ribosomal protein L9 [Clostridia bacterium]